MKTTCDSTSDRKDFPDRVLATAEPHKATPQRADARSCSPFYPQVVSFAEDD